MKLNELLSIEKGARTRIKREMSDLYKQAQKTSLFSGMYKKFEPTEEGGVVFPPEKVNVQVNVRDVMEQVAGHTAELLNVVSRKDLANCSAFADVVVGDEVILEGVPATHLLWLEKHLVELQNFVGILPVLDSSEDWNLNEVTQTYVTDQVRTHRTQKKQKPIVLFPATPEHPAQTQLISEDVIIGEWVTVKETSAIPMHEKKQLLNRINVLLDATKVARERANSVQVAPSTVGTKVSKFLFG